MADKDISILNNLIKTTLDSIKGFEDAAEHAHDRFSSVIGEFPRERRHVVLRLQEEVRRLGGTPEDDGSFLGAAHRTFMDLKQSMTSRDDRAIIAEIERGEDHLKEKYEDALREEDISPQVRAVIDGAFASVREGHDRASALKHSMANES